MTKKKFVYKTLYFKMTKFIFTVTILGKKESVILNIKRIKSILSRKDNDDDFERKEVCVKFVLKSFGVNDILENEKIIETKENNYIVEGKYHNEFVAIQRLLSFGASAIVLEPQEIKAKIIQKLKDMRENYNG